MAAESPLPPPPVPVRRLWHVLYSMLYWPYLMLSSAGLFLPALLLYLLTAPWDRQRRLLARYTNWWGAHYLEWAPGASVQVAGRAGLNPNQACIYVANHQSMVDILAVHATRLSFLWVSKIINFYVPFLGWNMWLNRHVPLKRGYLPSILRMVRTCERRLREGDSLFVFPEGTRSPDGTLRAFYRGAFWLAARNQVPVVPMVIEGTAQILPKRSFCIAPGPVQVQLLEPVHPASVDNDSRQLQAVVHARMLATQRRFRAEPVRPTAAAAPPTMED